MNQSNAAVAVHGGITVKKNTTKQFLIGSWVSFYPFDIDSYEYQLDQMAEAGLNFNIFPAVFGGGMQNAELWDNVEKQYAARNMYYCMNGGLNDDMLKEGVAYAKGKEHCIGYHLIDEPGGGALPTVGHYVRAYREADGKRYPFVNLFPSYVGNAVLEGDYYQYCSRFVREAGVENIEYLSHDFYPFHLAGTALSIFGDMEVIRRVAFENERLRTHAFPQSTAWMGTRMPNIDEMRWNVYGYLAYGFKALSWFNLVCPGKSDTEGECFRESVIYRDGQIHNKQLLADFGKLNREVHTLGDTLMKLDTVHAYHTRDGIAGVEMLPTDWMITPVGEENFVISHMVTCKGDETYVMLFNMDWEKPVTGSFRINEYSGIESMEYVSPFTGEHESVEIRDGVLTDSFRAGEGKLYKLNGKLSCRVLPLDFEHSRLDVDLPTNETIVGVDVSFPLHNEGLAVALQISTNKKFTEEKTTVHLFTELPDSGKLRFEPTVGKYIRLSVGGDGDDPAYGWGEIRVRFADESEIPVDDRLPVSVKEPTPVVIPLGATIEEAASMLPDALVATYANQEEVTVTPVWDMNSLDTSLSGTRQITGSIILPDGTPAPISLNARIQITVTYEVDFTDLDEAIAVVDGLNESEYSSDSWKLVKDYYTAAVAMKDGTYPQNAVTVAAWQLLDRVRELEPVQWTIPVQEDAEASAEDKKGLHVAKGILPAAVATLAGAVAGAFVGIFASKKMKKK